MKQLDRLNEIGKELSKREESLALLALGSVGVFQARINKYSDLDFFVICKEGSKSIFLDKLDWLEACNEIVFSFRNTIDGYKVLFEDDIFCEFAIFEPKELINVKFSQGRIVWRREGFDEMLLEPTVQKDKQNSNPEYLVNEALTNLYIGLGRYHRGEKLSAFNFIQNYAFNCVLELMTLNEEPLLGDEDLFNISRRFEQRFPKSTQYFKTMLGGYEYTIEAAKIILNYLDEHYTVNNIFKEKIQKLIDE